jgi:inner membrane protein
MNTTQHIVGAGLAAIPLYLIANLISGGINIYLFYIPAIVGGVLPDIIEPAKDWKHRKFYHSKRMLKKVSLGFVILFAAGFLWNPLFYLAMFLYGYVIHLLQDWTTKVGLPK